MGKPINAIVVLADGFEEVEALAPIDILRRAGADVTVAGLGGNSVRGAHDVYVTCDAFLENAAKKDYDVVVLPGGMPGAKNLHESKTVNDLIMKTYNSGKLVSAICASPAVVLAPLGILEGKHVVCYPGMEVKGLDFGTEKAYTDANVITGRGPGCALEFALEIVGYLYGKELKAALKEGLVL